MLVVIRETKAKLVKEETRDQPDKMVFPVNGVLKVKQGQEVLLDRGDYRGILESEAHPVPRDHRALRVHREYRVFKA